MLSLFSNASAPPVKDLWHISRCKLATKDMHAMIDKDGVALWPITKDERRYATERECWDNGDPEVNSRAAPTSARLLAWCDLLGAKVDRDAQTVSLLHCPRKSGRCEKPSRKTELLLFHLSQSDMAALDASDVWASQVNAHSFDGGAKDRHYLVLVNPTSGNGSAPLIWRRCEPMLSSVPGLTFEVHETVSNREAESMARTLDISAYAGIVIVSGDGLVHEIVNGLATRSDSHTAIRLPICHIPGGSGNGLASSVLAACGERFGVTDAAFLLGKGLLQPLNLARCESQIQSRISFLSSSWGMISDIDFESEALRCLGSIRFTLWAVWALLRRRKYKGVFSYWPVDEGEPPLLPPVDQPLPDIERWRVISGDFSTIWAMNVSHGSSDAIPAPDAKLSDGQWHVLVLRHVSRIQQARFLLGLETGTHLQARGAEIISCKAFRLVPESGRLGLDGEEIPSGTLQLRCADFCAQVIGCAP